MKKVCIILVVLCLLPLISFAGDSTGCGLGTTLWKGQQGIVPQTLAITTNGTSGSQTFGITSGTSHCDSNGKITGAKAQFAAFLENNVDTFVLDVAKGEGETINAVANIAKVDSKEAGKVLKDNFDYLFPNENLDVIELSEKVAELLNA